MTTNITELAQSLKAAADREMIYRDGAETSEIWERNVTPENILALVEVLENSESRLHEVAVACATAEQALEKSQQQMTESENRVRKQNRHICELFDDNTALRQRIAGLEARTVKLPDELSGETLLDVASRTDLVYSDDTGVLEYTNVNGCFVKVTAPPDKVIRFRCSNKRIYMRLVDRVKTHEHAGIIIDFPKKL
ncbi:hypothetical protein [Klebsiella pneumoniae]|uniref:hypothetical protein n=1 Tax=Klebsiella pneumoniae TaxID=573 RepID=UPI0011DD0E06|nr:hypothetical protein [Klebsiella pneumoniae]TXW13578.1 hypothetical protein D4M60_04925 [Klebsiella pneumoniae]